MSGTETRFGLQNRFGSVSRTYSVLDLFGSVRSSSFRFFLRESVMGPKFSFGSLNRFDLVS